MLSRILLVVISALALATAADKVHVSLYYEVFCPGCEQVITISLKKIMETPDMAAITDLELVPYGNAKVITRDPPTFECQHGEGECYGNFVELCSQKHFPEKAWDFILCEETSVDFSDDGVKKCSAAVGIDANEILECAKGTEGPLLHLEAADKTPEHKYVPWMLIDGKRRDSSKSVLECICEAYKGEKPASCKDIQVEEEAPKVKATLYYEAYCGGCEYLIKNDLKQLHELPDMMAITDLELVPYGNAHVITRDPPTFECQHGEKECYGNWVELCAQKHFSEQAWDFILCEEESVDFSDEGIKKCSAAAGFDADVILECAKGPEGPKLHLEAADKTPDHQWVPWMLVDGKLMGEQDHVLQMICDAYQGEKPASCKQFQKAPKVKASLYYEVYCPGCQEFILNDLKQFRQMEDMMAITDLEIVPYGNAHVITRDPPTFKCQHGDKECYGNWVELCVQKHFSEQAWDYIFCQEESADFSDEGIKKCSAAAGIDADVVLECAKGTEGPKLHLEAADKTPDHKWVPWVVVDGKLMGEEDNFLKMVCDAYQGEKPASCN